VNVEKIAEKEAAPMKTANWRDDQIRKHAYELYLARYDGPEANYKTGCRRKPT
jgi:hypothetical protein